MRPSDIVLTHGFVLDAQGRKMAKSVGNVVAPQTVIKESGAGHLRLWVAASDYSDDLRIGQRSSKPSSRTYKKLRNTMRWMLGALGHYDGVPASASGDMDELERHMRHKLFELDREVRQAYREFDYKRVVARLSLFLNTDLSAFYSTSARTRCTAIRSPAAAVATRWRRSSRCFAASRCGWRRSSVFTADEAWLARYPEATSVHLEPFPQVPADWAAPETIDRWITIRSVRAAVTGALEIARAGEDDRRLARSVARGPTWPTRPCARP